MDMKSRPFRSHRSYSIVHTVAAVSSSSFDNLGGGTMWNFKFDPRHRVWPIVPGFVDAGRPNTCRVRGRLAS